MSYVPAPIDTSAVVLDAAIVALTERLAENTHDVWAQGRVAEGWTFGPKRDDATKQHPGLVPYAALSDSEKEYDRRTALETIKAILALGYTIARPAETPAAPVPAEGPRVSEASMALIRRESPRGIEWLTQYNERWEAFHLVGGHRKPGESPRECCVREVVEELGLGPLEFAVAGEPRYRAEYDAYSWAARRETHYVTDLFEVTITPAAAERISLSAENRWVTQREIERQCCKDGKRVSETMAKVLGIAGLLTD